MTSARCVVVVVGGAVDDGENRSRLHDVDVGLGADLEIHGRAGIAR